LTTDLWVALTTAVIAVVSALISLLIGIPSGFWLRSLGPQSKRLVTAILVIPFLLPALLFGIAIRAIFPSLEIDAEFGILAISLMHAVMNSGFVSRVVSGARVTKSQLEQAQLEGASTIKIRLKVELPQLRSRLAAASLLVALYSATSYGLVLLMGQGRIKTLETEIAKSALQFLDLERAALLALLQTLLTLALFWLSRATPESDAALQQTEVRTKSHPVERLIGISYLATVSILLVAVFTRSLTGPGLANYTNLWSTGARNTLNISVLEASMNSLRNMLVVVLISLPIAYLAARGRKPSFLVLLPLGISPVVFGLTALVFSGYLPRELSGSWLLLPLIQFVFVMPLAYQILRPAIQALPRETLEAATLDGASAPKRTWFVELPQLKGPLAIAVSFTALASLGEFGAASFLALGSQETLPIVMFRLMGRPGLENYGMAMAAATIYILLTACVVYITTGESRTRRKSLASVQR
jgi:thiamine transport system permease protein